MFRGQDRWGFCAPDGYGDRDKDRDQDRDGDGESNVCTSVQIWLGRPYDDELTGIFHQRSGPVVVPG